MFTNKVRLLLNYTQDKFKDLKITSNCENWSYCLNKQILNYCHSINCEFNPMDDDFIYDVLF